LYDQRGCTPGGVMERWRERPSQFDTVGYRSDQDDVGAGSSAQLPSEECVVHARLMRTCPRCGQRRDRGRAAPDDETAGRARTREGVHQHQPLPQLEMRAEGEAGGPEIQYRHLGRELEAALQRGDDEWSETIVAHEHVAQRKHSEARHRGTVSYTRLMLVSSAPRGSST
jgi:hypothetical protein